MCVVATQAASLSTTPTRHKMLLRCRVCHRADNGTAFWSGTNARAVQRQRTAPSLWTVPEQAVPAGRGRLIASR